MKYRIFLMEYESGWGSRVDEVLHFDTYEEANIYKKKFNSKNTEKKVPDWYMVAEGPYEVETL